MFLAQYAWCTWSGWAMALTARVKDRSAPGRGNVFKVALPKGTLGFSRLVFQGVFGFNTCGGTPPQVAPGVTSAAGAHGRDPAPARVSCTAFIVSACLAECQC